MGFEVLEQFISVMSFVGLMFVAGEVPKVGKKMRYDRVFETQSRFTWTILHLWLAFNRGDCCQESKRNQNGANLTHCDCCKERKRAENSTSNDDVC